MKDHLSQHDLIARGLARLYRGRLIPIIRGASGEDEPLFPPVPEDLSTLTGDELAALETALADAIREVTSDPVSFVTPELSSADLVAAAREAAASLQSVRDHIASLSDEPAEAPEAEAVPADEAPADGAPADEAAAEEPVVLAEDELVELASIADSVEAPAVAEPVEEPAATPAPAAVVASAAAAAAPPPALARPTRAHRPVPSVPDTPRVSLTAAASGLGRFELGQPIDDPFEVARMMMARHGQFGGKGDGSRYPILRANWSDSYGPDRTLDSNIGRNMTLIQAVTNPTAISDEMARRRKSLTAAGGYCAPSTPLYQLAMYSTTARPVRDSLPSFGADRGGVRLAAPATLGSISTAIGRVSASDDALGGTFATKTCQVVDCPPFTETLAEALWHCNQFGNMIARAFPELVNQWTDLTMAAHARLAESFLLSRIDDESTAVTAADIGLGATSALLPQILQAAVGYRSRHRMARDAVLRVMLPAWTIELMISDVIRSQFERFNTDDAKLTALLRTFNVEPTWYIDGAAGAGQVFGSQSAGALLGFPATVRWYIFAEGSFIYLDGGELELGIVRDSTLNATNDFQVFGEIFENVARAGAESLAVTSTVCATGEVAAPATVTGCPV